MWISWKAARRAFVIIPESVHTLRALESHDAKKWPKNFVHGHNHCPDQCQSNQEHRVFEQLQDTKSIGACTKNNSVFGVIGISLQLGLLFLAFCWTEIPPQADHFVT